MALQPKNYYDRCRVHCTCDDRTQASRLSGQTWNIINNREDHEVYLREVRNSDHFVDERGNATGHWMHRKKRVDLDGDGVIDTHDSSNMAEVLVCPKTAGKEAAQRRTRQCRQLLQASAPNDFGTYSSRRTASVAPPTPRRGGDLERRMPFQERLRDLPPKPTPRQCDRGPWSARRGEPRPEPRPPQEHDMFRTVDQLRAESHADLQDPNFAATLHSARASSLTGTSALAASGAATNRSQFVGRWDQPSKPGAALTRNSKHRIEAHDAREISSWPLRHDRLQREDPYYVKPVQQQNGSSVKYDILSNERRQFWY